MAPRVGLVGLGKIVLLGQLPSYMDAGIEVVAAADISQDAVNAFRRMHAAPNTGTDIDRVLSDPAVDVVDIAAPPAAHRDLVMRALAAGKHVICQKPLTMSIAEGEEMVAAAAARGLKFAVNQNVRYTPANLSIADWVDRHAIGTPHAATIEYHAPLSYEAWRAALPHMVLSDGALHHIDLLRWWFGTPHRVFAAETHLASVHDGAATYAVVTETYSSGLVATVQCDWASPAGESSFNITVHGDAGVIRVEGSKARCYRKATGVWEDGRPADPSQWKPGVGFLPAFAACTQGFLDAVETGGEPPTSAADNLATLDILFAAHESIESGEAVNVRQRRVASVA